MPALSRKFGTAALSKSGHFGTEMPKTINHWRIVHGTVFVQRLAATAGPQSAAHLRLVSRQQRALSLPSFSNIMARLYYTTIFENQEYSSIRPLVDWLDYNGCTVVIKPTKEFIDVDGRRRVKGNMHIELAVDAMELSKHIEQMVLFSGDGDFRPLVEAMQRRGVQVTVVSTISTQPAMIADELRRQADVFLDLRELQSRIARDPVERLLATADRPRTASPGVQDRHQLAKICDQRIRARRDRA